MAVPVVSAFANAWNSFVTTFKKEYRTHDPLPTWQQLNSFSSFSSYPGRLTRYALYWAMFENTAYDDAHKFGPSFKEAYGLYRSTRGTYNPCHRLGELWASLIWGGALDPDAGDGLSVPSALPILTKNEAVRPAIARLWRDSQWQVNKTMCARIGAVLGDAVIKINDDPTRGRVTLDVIHPGTVKWIDTDVHGEIKAYVIQENRWDPRFDDAAVSPFFQPTGVQQVVLYTEEAYLDGDSVVYRTYLDGEPYAWEGDAAEWRVPYGFIPLELIQHMKMGPEDRWGWSELHAGITKFIEADDLGSKLHDQIRKIVEGIWLLAGVQPPSPLRASTTSPNSIRLRGTDPTDDDPDPGRQEMKVLYGSSGASATPLILPVDVQFTSQEIQNLINNFKEDYPELQYDSARVSGDASAKALREVRKKAEAKVQERRAGYDARLVRAMRKAVAVAGWRGYDGFRGFGLRSLDDGALDFAIGKRTVFEVDVLDEIEKEMTFWTAAKMAADAGCPLEVFLRRNRWTDEQIADYAGVRAREIEERILAELKVAQAKAGATPQPGAAAHPEPSPQHDPQAAQAGS